MYKLHATLITAQNTIHWVKPGPYCHKAARRNPQRNQTWKVTHPFLGDFLWPIWYVGKDAVHEDNIIESHRIVFMFSAAVYTNLKYPDELISWSRERLGHKHLLTSIFPGIFNTLDFFIVQNFLLCVILTFPIFLLSGILSWHTV